MTSRLERDIDKLVAENGINDVVNELAHYCARNAPRVPNIIRLGLYRLIVRDKTNRLIVRDKTKKE